MDRVPARQRSRALAERTISICAMRNRQREWVGSYWRINGFIPDLLGSYALPAVVDCADPIMLQCNQSGVLQGTLWRYEGERPWLP
jgi:hypothetical protein